MTKFDSKGLAWGEGSTRKSLPSKMICGFDFVEHDSNLKRPEDYPRVYAFWGGERLTEKEITWRLMAQPLAELGLRVQG